jgi:hypothetical protein
MGMLVLDDDLLAALEAAGDDAEEIVQMLGLTVDELRSFEAAIVPSPAESRLLRRLRSAALKAPKPIRVARTTLLCSVNANVLATLMRASRITVPELCDRSGLDPRMVRKALNMPGAAVTRDTLMALASAFNARLSASEQIDWTHLVDVAPDEYFLGPREDFLAKFRQCFRGLHDLIDPRGLPGADLYQLDSLYVPLRLVSNERRTAASELDAVELLARRRHLTILGPPGSGKTTWLRWTFRQLLSQDALPLPIDLRMFSRSWDAANRDLLQYLPDWLSEYMEVNEDLLEDFRRLFRDPGGPRPVLLLDGWDQLGAVLGAELHDKLIAFLRSHPRVLAVVTSRLYGKGRPGRNDNFEVMKLRPLDKLQMMRLVRQYSAALAPHEGDSWGSSIETAIEISPQLQEFARNAVERARLRDALAAGAGARTGGDRASGIRCTGLFLFALCERDPETAPACGEPGPRLLISPQVVGAARPGTVLELAGRCVRNSGLRRR